MTKSGFTQMEMLLVLTIVSILMLVSASFSEQLFCPAALQLYQIESLIENARFEAIKNHKTVIITFENDCIYVDQECYFENSGLVIDQPQKISFNANGRINHGTHLDLKIGKQNFQLTFNVGEGAYHIEKNSFYSPGCIIWIMDLFKYFSTSFWMPDRSFKPPEAKRTKDNGAHCQVAGKRGFTLIEALLALLINALILLSMSTLFNHLSEAFTIQNNSDLAFAIIQLTEDVNTALNIECDPDSLTLIYSEKTVHYYLDNGRLVKTPGFDIYLHYLDDIEFQNDGTYMYILIKRGNHSERFQIGTYFRPSKERICQSDGSFNSEFSDDIDSGINSDDQFECRTD